METLVKTAELHVEQAKAASSLKDAQDELKAAKEAMQQAQDTFNQSKKDLEKAQAASNAAEQVLAEKTEDVQKAQDNLNHATTDTASAQAALDTAKAEEANAKTNAENAKSAVENAQTTLDSAKEEKKSAEQDVQTAKAEAEAAQKEYDAAKAYADAATEKISQGAFGFYEEMGATEALDVLNNAKYADATKKGSATDATSLENMKASLAFLEEYLELRAQEGYTGNTYVTDYYMAIAQSNANKSAETFDHCRQYNVGENLAWGWKDPFDGWYTEEKKLYEQDPGTTEAGHYKNIANSNYLYTGFAINNEKYSACL